MSFYFSSFCSSNALTGAGEKCYNYTIIQTKVSDPARIEHHPDSNPVFMKTAGHAPKLFSLPTEWHWSRLLLIFHLSLKVTKEEESYPGCENEGENNDVVRPERIDHALTGEKKMFWMLLCF